MPTVTIKQREQQTEEVMRACAFLVGQIKKGWTPQEAFAQVHTSYGVTIHESVVRAFKRWSNKQ